MAESGWQFWEIKQNYRIDFSAILVLDKTFKGGQFVTETNVKVHSYSTMQVGTVLPRRIRVAVKLFGIFKFENIISTDGQSRV